MNGAVPIRSDGARIADRLPQAHRRLPPESLETTSLHLDVLSDLKRIHSHICSVAYPLLEAAGELPMRDNVKSGAATDALTYQPKLP